MLETRTHFSTTLHWKSWKTSTSGWNGKWCCSLMVAAFSAIYNSQFTPATKPYFHVKVTRRIRGVDNILPDISDLCSDFQALKSQTNHLLSPKSLCSHLLTWIIFIHLCVAGWVSLGSQASWHGMPHTNNVDWGVGATRWKQNRNILLDTQFGLYSRRSLFFWMSVDTPDLATANWNVFCFLFVKNHLFAWRANQWPLDREIFFLFRSSQQLPRLHHGPYNGFLSW